MLLKERRGYAPRPLVAEREDGRLKNYIDLLMKERSRNWKSLLGHLSNFEALAVFSKSK